MYATYLARAAILERNRRFTDEVRAATSGSGKTPVEPLATMGKHGGPLLCDVCAKPMILEGGVYQGMFADAAWLRNPAKGWASYISGGMVVLVESNGTLRLYHGYPGRSGCAKIADDAERKLRAAFRARPDTSLEKLDLLAAYFKAELPEKSSDAVLTEIDKLLFAYDPGLGINAVE
jgi:hypothetical protein